LIRLALRDSLAHDGGKRKRMRTPLMAEALALLGSPLPLPTCAV
jgi:hypothetical protein